MASTEEMVAEEVYRCYHCGLESTGNSFKYFDNKKVDQPRFQCEHCHKLFTLGSHGRPQGKTYTKKRNEDPAELKSLSRQCRHCGVADNAAFKYYNNNNVSQPRFKCLSCGKQFQMRLLGTGEGRHLVHTLSQKTRAPYRWKQGMPEPIPNASSNFEEGSYQPFDGSFIPVPSDLMMPREPDAKLLPEMGDEDVQYSNFLEAELVEDYETGSGDNLEPLTSSGEDAGYSNFLEAEILAEENHEAPNDDAFSSMANVADALPPTWSTEDAELMGFMEAGVRYNEAPYADMVSDNMAEMVSESTSDNAEVMYGTLALESPVASSSELWTTLTHNNFTSVDSYNMSYADAAAACCFQMDLDTAPWALAT